MATNNNDARKKQKKTVPFDDDDDDSLSLSAPVVVDVVPPAVSFGTIVEEFPDFLSCILLYIADRVIWNSIASSNKEMYAKSKAILPPWPLYYNLPSDDLYNSIMLWSPCGTRMACAYRNRKRIVIFDQRIGPLRNYGKNNMSNNNVIGWLAHDDSYIFDFKFSSDGRFLVSTSSSVITLWDCTGNYEQLQEWNMREETNISGDYKVSISACSKYIAVALGNWMILKDVENGKTIKSLMPLALEKIITKSVFSSDGRAIFICCDGMIQIWRPYLDNDDDDRLVTLWRQSDTNQYYIAKYKFSHDTKMVAIYSYNQRGTIWSIDMDRNRLTHKSDFPGRNYKGIYFNQDRYIGYYTRNGPTFRSRTDDESTDSTIHVLDNRYNNKRNLVEEGVSSNNQQLIVQDLYEEMGSGNPYVTSYFMK